MPDTTPTLRDRIAQALYQHSHPGWALSYADLDEDQRDTYQGRADAVLAVLPAPVDRAAVTPPALTEEGHRFALSVTFGLGTGAPWDTIHERVAELRRLADETPTADAGLPARLEAVLTGAKQRLDLPRIVVICGSTRFMADMAEHDLRETAAGRIVVKPGCDMKTPHPLWADPADAERLKAELDGLHRAKIRLADDVLVVGDYIGDSTRAEIAYARELGKPIRFTHPEVDTATKDPR